MADAQKPRPCSPWLFFLATIVFSWTLWSLSALAGGIASSMGFFLYFLGGIGPLFSSVAVMAYCRGGPGIRNLLSRTLAWRGIQLKWLVLGLLIIFVPVFTAALLESALFGTWMSNPMVNAIIFLSSGTGLLVSIIFNLIASVFEEPGWRGLAQEHLQRKYSALTSAIVIGVVWALWHMPLFVLPGTYQAGIGLWSAGFWLYMAAVPATSILIAWFYNSSGGLILAAIVYHLMNNLAGEIFSLDLQFEVIRVVCSYIIAALIILYFGHERLNENSSE